MEIVVYLESFEKRAEVKDLGLSWERTIIEMTDPRNLSFHQKALDSFISTIEKKFHYNLLEVQTLEVAPNKTKVKIGIPNTAIIQRLLS